MVRNEQLKALRDLRVSRLAFGQRRDLDRIVGHERRLHELVLDERVECLCKQLAAGRRLVLDLKAERLCLLACFLVARKPVEIHARVLLDRIVHRDARKRGREIDPRSLIGDLRRAVHRRAAVRNERLRKLHHAVQIRIGLVCLDRGEFGVVRRVHALVAEQTADLIDALEAADDALLEVQLRGDPHIHIDIERVMVRDERARRRAARGRVEHGCFHLNKAAAVHEPADLRDDPAALFERVAHFGVHDEIDKALPVAELGVLESVELLGQRAQRFGQQPDRGRVDGDLARARFEHGTRDAHDIADIKLFERRIALFADVVALDIDLNVAFAVEHVCKAGLAHDAFRHHAARDAHRFALVGFVVVQNIGAVLGLVKGRDLIRIRARLLQSGELFPADLQKLGKLLLGLFLCHGRLLFHDDFSLSFVPL